MRKDFPSPDGYAQGWRLISRDAACGRNWIDAVDGDQALLLVLDTHGDWWAVAAHCRQCTAPLASALHKDTTGTGFDELRCTQCGSAHGPAVNDCECVALMVVDDEIYAAPDVDVSDDTD